ncbi:hypothetical protein EOM86_05170 [Candidatus Nomurabacteria bacterium]|nr:hypothetical protein [Candidatus Nomurabacteria bacterium]
MNEIKYLIVKDHAGLIQIVLFGGMISHCDVAVKGCPILSAGFCAITKGSDFSDELRVHVHYRLAISLGVPPNPSYDEALIAQMINRMNHFPFEALGYPTQDGKNSPVIWLNKAETQSGLDRVAWAESLIEQMPEDRKGRNSWLINYGRKAAARDLRAKAGIEFDARTLSAKTKK